MRVRVVLALLASAALAAAALAVLPARAADPYQEVSLRIGRWVVALFPPAEGRVVSVVAGEVYVDLAGRDLIRPGMELQVWRPGGEMVHPVTGRALGAFESHLGWVRIAEVRERYSRGSLAEGAKPVHAGDRARVSARRLRALLLVTGAAPGVSAGPLVEALVGRLAESGRVSLLDEPAWAPHLAALGGDAAAVLADPARLRSLGERSGADLLLVLRLGEDAGRVVAAADLRSLHTGASFGELVEPWPAAPGPPPAAPAARELIAPVVALAAGDLLGEGRTEVLVSGGADLVLYRWGEQALAWRWDEEGRGGRRVLFLDAIDVDGDGRAEILVGEVDRGRLRTQVRSWRDGGLAVVAEADGVYLRAVDRPGGAPVLLGQRAGIDEVFAGPVERYRLAGGSLAAVPGTALPRGVNVFGLALAPAGGSGALFALDGAGALRCLGADGAPLWSGERAFGGAAVGLRAEDLFGAGLAPRADVFEEQTRVLQGRLLAWGDAGEGTMRIAVPRSVTEGPGGAGGPRRDPARGEIVVLAGVPPRLVETTRSAAVEGPVADLARTDVDGDGRPEVLFAVNRDRGAPGGRGRLVLWEVP